MKINFKKLIVYIIITFFIGSFFSLFVGDSLNDNIKRIIEVPSYIFPIVWSILYLLMGISSYIISESNDLNSFDALKSYFLQLLVNSLWSLIFFGFKLYFISFLWIILLIILVIIMIIKFYKINKIAGIMNIPYMLWLLFASILNLSIIILN